MGIAASGAGRKNNRQLCAIQLQFGQDVQLSALGFNFSKIISIGSGCGRTEY